MATREELNAQAREQGIENPESFNTKAELEDFMESVIHDVEKAEATPIPIDEPVEDIVAPAPSAVNEGSQIAEAIAKGMENVGKGRPIKISADKSVQSVFSVVRSKATGEVMIRENATGVLSKVQLKSLEEQEASMQNEAVEDIV